MITKSNLIPTAFLIFGLMCAVFAFFTEISQKVFWISSSFYLQMSIASFLVAIYFQASRKA